MKQIESEEESKDFKNALVVLYRFGFSSMLTSTMHMKSSFHWATDLSRVHCKNCGVLCTPNEQHTIGVISHLMVYLVC